MTNPIKVKIPGRGSLPVSGYLRLTARETHGRGRIDVSVPFEDSGFSFGDAIGGGRAKVHIAKRSATETSFGFSVRASIANGWHFSDAAISFEIALPNASAVIPSGWGREISAFPDLFRYDGNYPGWSCCAQFMALQCAEGGISVSVVDPNLELKYLRLTRAAATRRFQLDVIRVPERDGSDWVVDDTCDIILATHRGEWTVAAKDYRCRQNAIRPELNNPIRHSLTNNDPYWLTHHCFAYDDHNEETMLDAIRALKGPALVHLYNWSGYPFDTNYPDIDSSRPTLEEEIVAMRKLGALSFPYVNGRIWDRSTESYKTSGKRAELIEINGKPATETYPSTSNAVFSVACPSDSSYRKRLVSVIESVVRRHRLAGVYIDQLGAAFGQRCYADNHSHRPGGALSWNAGHRALLTELRTAIDPLAGGRAFLTTENASEPLVDLLDGFLYYCGRPYESIGQSAPVWQAIYGDFGHGFADNFDKDWTAADGGPSDALLFRVARQAVMGVSLGWLPPNLIVGAYEPVADLMNASRSARLPHYDFIRNATPLIAGLDTTGESTGALTGAWTDGSRTVALAVNPTRSAIEAKWLDGKRMSLPPLGAAARAL